MGSEDTICLKIPHDLSLSGDILLFLHWVCKLEDPTSQSNPQEIPEWALHIIFHSLLESSENITHNTNFQFMNNHHHALVN